MTESTTDLIRAFRANAAALRALLVNVEGTLPSTRNSNTQRAIERRQAMLLVPIESLRHAGQREIADALLDEHALLSDKDAGRSVDEGALRTCFDFVAVALMDERQRGYSPEDILAIGGKAWRRFTRSRVYLPIWVWAPLAGLDLDYDRTVRPMECTGGRLDGARLTPSALDGLTSAVVFLEDGLLRMTVAEVFSAYELDGPAYQARVLAGVQQLVRKATRR